MFKIIKVTNGGKRQLLIYIPKALKEALGLEKGCYARVFVDDGKLIVEPLYLSIKAHSSMGKYLQKSKEEGGRAAAPDLPGATERLQEQAGGANRF